MSKADITLINRSPLRIRTRHSIVHAINAYKSDVELTLSKFEMQWLLSEGFDLLAGDTKTIIKLD